MLRLLVFLIITFIAQSAAAQAGEDATACSTSEYGPQVCIHKKTFAKDLCAAFEYFSNRYSLDTYFFMRLIWQESRFDPNAKSPADAMGIAQFINTTAQSRGLDDPFNPAKSLDASARYLADLIDKFGNVGLASAAYNAGETAAANFKAAKTGLPNETWKYVQIITGVTAKQWRDTPPKVSDFSFGQAHSFQEACLDLTAKRKLSPFNDTNPQYKKWGVQLAAGKTLEAAAISYKHRSRLCKRAIKEQKPDYIYSSPQVKIRRPTYVARISFDGRRKANAFCTRLKQYGCSCAVYKN